MEGQSQLWVGLWERGGRGGEGKSDRREQERFGSKRVREKKSRKVELQGGREKVKQARGEGALVGHLHTQRFHNQLKRGGVIPSTALSTTRVVTGIVCLHTTQF